jgi:FtsZ-binding cell division protein ZapB
VSEISKFEALERKITQAIDKVATLKEENRGLQAQLKEAKAKNANLSREMSGKTKVAGKDPDLRKLRGKVDSLLEKIEALEL